MRQRRSYFYRMDSRGRLFHEETELNDPHFLDFFISRIRKNETGIHPEFPYLSICAGEWNFIQPTTSVFVFQKLEEEKLFYSPNHSLRFEPDRLRIFRNSLVHPDPFGEWGFFSSDLLLEISNRMIERENEFYFQTNSGEFRIPVIL
ncbi:DUF4505 family protein [Leptospira sp. 201903071]|uniref:DUF4505 family protein n=1 Tax=Leptospira ainazelensis TaxID=2810034 RepID=UPI0019630C4E|nr:DUF4505 family protein [Leptospira ainazelensis]MBM9501834.1 DUF4505 family protein [Leptospira ainazelensis]